MSYIIKTFILPILLITILCISAVEVFYYFGEKYLQAHDKRRESPSATVSATGRETIIKDVKKPVNSSVITRRNLFASLKSSQVKVEKEDSLATVALSSMDVVLMGTISGAGDGVRAVIYDKKDKKQELFQVGDYIQQAIIKQIMRGKVILNLNGKDEMLDISEARNVKIAQVAKINPVVQTRKVVGRPVGQPVNSNNGEVNGNLPPGVELPPGVQLPAGVQPGNVRTSQPRQLRSYRGGVIVKGKSAAPSDQGGK